MTTVSQRSFSGGEIAPAMYARVDQVKYATGLRTCRNFIVMRHGGVTNRPGGEFVCEIEDSSDVARITEFVFNDDQTYVLLWGDTTLRIIKDGILQRETATTITGITQADPPVVTTSASHGYSDGDEVYITSVVGMTQVNTRSFLVSNKTATTFELQTKDGTDLDASSFTAYTSGGSCEKVYQVTTPYLKAELPELHFVQSADVVTLTHPNHEPRELTRTGDTSWSLDVITFAPTIDYPTSLSVAAGGAGSNTYDYKVTARHKETGEESLAAVGGSSSITDITSANPPVVTIGAHPFESGDILLIESVGGMTELNDRRFSITYIGPNTFSLDDVDATAYTAYTSGGTAKSENYQITSAAAPTTANPHVITWNAVANATEYYVYRAFNNVYGFIGIAGTNSFDDDGTVAAGDEDTTDTPPAFRNPFLLAGNYPSTVTLHQQRRILANTDNNVEKVWVSRTGDYGNFTKSNPRRDDDSLDFNLAGLKVNEVQSMTSVNGQLVQFTVDGEWAIQGNVAGALVATDTPNPMQYSFNGANKLQPLLINNTALYVQNRESRVRDFIAEADFASYGGSDLTVFSSHLFENKTITDMTYQQIPHSVAWFVRSDGVLLGLTYLREQEILGWHRHDFEGGTVESIASVPEGNEDAVYVIVKRTIDVQGTDTTVRYVERLKPRVVTDVEDYYFVDSGVTLDGTNTAATTMTVSGGTDWDYTEDLTLTASVSHFSSADVDTKEIHITDSAGALHRFKITAFTSATVVTVRVLDGDVPTILQSVATTNWGDAVGVVSGLWHLEGEDISAFGDGYVVASANNASIDTVTVTNGDAVFTEKHVVWQVGLPITADLETLNVDSAQIETLAGKKAMNTAVIASVESSRGIWAGYKPPSDDATDPLENLTEYKLTDTEDLGTPPALVTDNIDTNITSSFTEGARSFLRQVDPVPCSILAIHAAGYFPFRG